MTQLVDQLDPDHAVTPILWLTDHQESEIAMDALRSGEPYSVGFSDDQAAYVFIAQSGAELAPVHAGRESAWSM
ncbi:hypothetical protein ABT095_34680 [Kitasatospora sp. NPDC002227]|uniref:hypothetical protein n=1 Tax=Kitasatospora sp. NPDC002227 TaxID=3154773 RepID=UPI0033344325